MVKPVPAPERRVYLGTVVKLRGLKGDLKVDPATWRMERWRELDRVWCRRRDNDIEYLTIGELWIDGRKLHLRFAECQSRELAEPLVGGELFIDESQRDPLPPDMYYHDEIIGCEVHESTRGELGVITGIGGNFAQDTWRIEGRFGEILLPAVREFVISIDLQAKRIEIRLPEGLIEI